jgi:hypothetical protein
MKGLALAVVGSCSMLLLAVGPALAAEPPKASEPAELIPKTRPTTKSFYGWEILATGGAGGVLTTAAVLLPENPVGTTPATAAFVVGMPLFVLGGPAVHWSHGGFEKGLVSFGANLALPFFGGLTGRSLRCSEANAPDDCHTRGFYTGLAIASLVTPVLDALLLGWEDVPIDDWTQHAVRHVPRLSMAPWLSSGSHGLVQLGLGGRF